MRTYLLFFVCLFFITGCVNTKKESNSEFVEKANDAYLANDVDSLSKNIWKNVRFGMTIDEVRNAKTFGDLEGDNQYYYIDVKNEDPSQLGVFTRELGEISISFGEKSGRLNFIHFKSKDNIYADHIDDMENDCHKIISIIEKGFNTEFQWKKYSVSITDFNEGERFDALSQSYGDTHIIVSMGKRYEGCTYYYEILASYQNPNCY